MRKERLELSRLAALEPKSSASTNSATLAGRVQLKKHQPFKQGAIVAQLCRQRKDINEKYGFIPNFNLQQMRLPRFARKASGFSPEMDSASSGGAHDVGVL